MLEDGTVIEEIERICPMTGFRTRWSLPHLGDTGYYQSDELGPTKTRRPTSKEWMAASGKTTASAFPTAAGG
ncbi:MAG: hypothetical protein M3272_07180 [Actinomycetota bacterium]|nr:hypothetical protein [Actinomycetota bacterium]